jgi:hypothetical protein
VVRRGLGPSVSPLVLGTNGFLSSDVPVQETIPGPASVAAAEQPDVHASGPVMPSRPITNRSRLFAGSSSIPCSCRIIRVAKPNDPVTLFTIPLCSSPSSGLLKAAECCRASHPLPLPACICHTHLRI